MSISFLIVTVLMELVPHAGGALSRVDGALLDGASVARGASPEGASPFSHVPQRVMIEEPCAPDEGCDSKTSFVLPEDVPPGVSIQEFVGGGPGPCASFDDPE